MASGPGRGKLRPVTIQGRRCWQGDWTDARGVRRRKVLGRSKADAEHVLGKIVRDRDLELAGMGGELGLSMPIEALAAQYLADLRTRARPRTMAGVRLALCRIQRGLGARVVRDLSRPALSAWRQQRVAAGASNKTVNTELGALHAALNLAVRLGQLWSNPIAGLRGLPTTARHQRRRPRALSEWEIARLLAVALAADAKHPGSIPREPLVRALLLTGARWGEITAATWGDIDLERGLLTLRAETTKTSCARVIPLDSGLLATALTLPGIAFRVTGRWPGQSDRIFLSPRGRPWPLHTGNFRKYLMPLFASAGISAGTAGTPTLHGLRHSFITRLARHGVPVATTQYLAGHKSPAMTLRVYTHLQAEETRRAIDSLPSIPNAATGGGENERSARTWPGVDGALGSSLRLP